jgi:peptidylprolyl isomerase
MRFAFLPVAVCAVAFAAAAAQASAKAAPVAPPTEADWRTPDPQNVLVIDTTKGRIFVELAPQVAPATAARARDLARAGFYDGRAFFRVIDGFMDQTGDPQDNGQGGSTQPNLPPEFTFRRGSSTPMVTVTKTNGLEAGYVGSLPVLSQSMDLAVLTADHKVKAWGTFCPEVVGMARADAPDSGNSQFFLMRGYSAGPAPDGAGHRPRRSMVPRDGRAGSRPEGHRIFGLRSRRTVADQMILE